MVIDKPHHLEQANVLQNLITFSEDVAGTMKLKIVDDSGNQHVITFSSRRAKALDVGRVDRFIVNGWMIKQDWAADDDDNLATTEDEAAYKARVSETKEIKAKEMADMGLWGPDVGKTTAGVEAADKDKDLVVAYDDQTHPLIVDLRIWKQLAEASPMFDPPPHDFEIGPGFPSRMVPSWAIEPRDRYAYDESSRLSLIELLRQEYELREELSLVRHRSCKELYPVWEAFDLMKRSLNLDKPQSAPFLDIGQGRTDFESSELLSRPASGINDAKLRSALQIVRNELLADERRRSEAVWDSLLPKHQAVRTWDGEHMEEAFAWSNVPDDTYREPWANVVARRLKIRG